MTALIITAAVIIVAAGAIIQFRTAAMTTESAGDGTDAAIPWPLTPPVDGEDPMAARGPSTAGPVAPFQIRPAAVQADLPDHPAPISGQQADANQGTPLSPATSPAPAAPTVPIDTATEPTEPSQPTPSADQTVSPAVDGTTAAPPQEPAAPAPVTATQTPPPQAPTPDPTPTPETTTAAPPSPATTPVAAPPRGNSARHLPEHANGGVGNTDHPKPSKPESGPKD
jgi:hypothetical protein